MTLPPESCNKPGCLVYHFGLHDTPNIKPPSPNRLYICGPMSGLPEHNFPAFHAVADRLGKMGYIVVNPAALEDGDTKQDWAHYLRRDIPLLLTCDVVVVLPNWQSSRGATLEVSIAQALSMPVWDAETLEPAYEFPAQEALRIVHSRERCYPHPTRDFTKIASIWSGIVDYAFKPTDVALMMAGLKLARESSHHKRDNLTDVIGYVECLELIHRANAV